MTILTSIVVRYSQTTWLDFCWHLFAKTDKLGYSYCFRKV